MNNLWFGDCLKLMDDIPDGKIDMILADLPYGTTYQLWDTIIPMNKLWDKYERIIKSNGAMVFTTSQPFSSLMICSKLEWFRCEWIWNKKNPTNFPNANKQPLKQHENILVFGKTATVYYPIKISGQKNHKQGKSKSNISETRLINKRIDDDLSGMKFPKTILDFPKHSSQCKFHPNQKPIELLEYLIKTYTLENEWVLDNTMGSGSTGVAANNLKRNFIGIENNKKYFDVAEQRILIDKE